MTFVLGIDNMASSLSNLDDVSSSQTDTQNGVSEKDPQARTSVDEVSTDSGVSASIADVVDAPNSETGCSSICPPSDYDVTQL